MIIPTRDSVVGAVLISMLSIIGGVYLMFHSSKEKGEYQHEEGQIEFIDKVYLDLPKRHPGEFCYVKIIGSTKVFEIYMPNSVTERRSMADLNLGDDIQVYFYEPFYEAQKKVTKFVQFVDHEGLSYYERNRFYYQLGCVMVGIGVLLISFAVYLGRRKKLEWL